MEMTITIPKREPKLKSGNQKQGCWVKLSVLLWNGTGRWFVKICQSRWPSQWLKIKKWGSPSKHPCCLKSVCIATEMVNIPQTPVKSLLKSEKEENNNLFLIQISAATVSFGLRRQCFCCPDPGRFLNRENKINAGN